MIICRACRVTTEQGAVRLNGQNLNNCPLSTVLVHWMVIISGVAVLARCAGCVDGPCCRDHLTAVCFIAHWHPATHQSERPWRQGREPPLKFRQTPWNGSRRQGILTVNHGGIWTVTFTRVYCCLFIYIYIYINRAYITTLAVAEAV